MSIVHHSFPSGIDKTSRANRVTIWLLIATLIVTFLALTFGDAEGFGLW